MAVTGVFLAPYRHYGKVNPVRNGIPGRVNIIRDYEQLILGDNGNYVYEECLGDMAVVLVRCNSAGTLNTIAQDAQIRRFPKALLDSPLSDLSAGQKNTLKTWVTDLGYTTGEIQSRFGSDLGAFTLRDVVRFILGRRLRPRLGVDGQTITLDGAQETPLAPETLEAQL